MEYNSSSGLSRTDACVAAGVFAEVLLFPPQTSSLWLNLPGDLGTGWTGAGGSDTGVRGRRDPGALQSSQEAAAKRAAPARARGECVFAIISIITTS